MRALHTVGDVAVLEGCTVFMPRRWQPGQSRPVIYCHSLGGTSLQCSVPVTSPGFARLARGVARRFPVVVTDLGGTNTWGTDPARDQIGDIQTFMETVYGCASGPALLMSASMGTLAALRWFCDNTFGALVSAIGLIDVADIRDNNRPGGWSGTTALSPFNVNAANLAYGLALNSTGDYPTHGQSLAALPAGANPATRTAELVGLRHLAYTSSDDTSCPPSVTAAHIAAIGPPAVQRNLGALGHTDAAAGAVPTDDAIDWFLAA